MMLPHTQLEPIGAVTERSYEGKLLDQLAGQVICGLYASLPASAPLDDLDYSELASIAYRQAVALMEARAEALPPSMIMSAEGGR